MTAFPTVLDQMAKNIQWTTALGEAYVNDPTDVMNAIQVMRQRAARSGALKSNAQLNVATVPATPVAYAPDPGYDVYSGPPVIEPPTELIEIAPAQPDVVYVPYYNPSVVYGSSVPYYPGYDYRPAPSYNTGAVVAAGVLSFGLGIAIASTFGHHDYGWNAWNVNWGHGHGGGRGGDGRDGRAGGAAHRPSVVYNNTTYVSRSTTVINRVSNRYGGGNVTNNQARAGLAPPVQRQPENGVQPGQQRPGMLTGGARQPGQAAGQIPQQRGDQRGEQRGDQPRGAGTRPGTEGRAGLGGAPNGARPDYSAMSHPNFNQGIRAPGAAANYNQGLRAPGASTGMNQARPGTAADAEHRPQPGATPQNGARPNYGEQRGGVPQQARQQPGTPFHAQAGQPHMQAPVARQAAPEARPQRAQPQLHPQAPQVHQAAPEVRQAAPQMHQAAPQVHQAPQMHAPAPQHQGGGGHPEGGGHPGGGGGGHPQPHGSGEHHG